MGEETAPKPGVGVGVVVMRGDRVLMVRRTTEGAGRWDLPGGYLGYCERLEDCALREVAEETGIRLVGASFLAVSNDIHPDGVHNVTVVMAGHGAEGAARVAAPAELDAAGWFAWDDLPTPRYLPLESLLAGRSYPPITLPPRA